MSKYHFYCRNLFQWNAPDAPLPTKLFLSFQNFHFRFRIKHKTPALLEWTRTKTKPFHVCCVCVWDKQNFTRVKNQKPFFKLSLLSSSFVFDCVFWLFVFVFYLSREKKERFFQNFNYFLLFFLPKFSVVSCSNIKKLSFSLLINLFSFE